MDWRIGARLRNRRLGGVISWRTACRARVTTGFVGRAAPFDRGAASGLYLAAYLSGELAIRA